MIDYSKGDSSIEMSHSSDPIHLIPPEKVSEII